LYRENVPHPIDLVLPDEPAAVRLMNTVWADRTGVHDALTGADDLRVLLGEMVVGAVTDGHVTAARRLRDALRRLAAAVTDDDRARGQSDLAEVAARDVVNAALATAPPPVLRRAGDGFELRYAAEGTVDAAVGALARQGAALVADPARPLRACLAPGCVLYFVRDRSRREWCGVACGNRARAARHYRRLRGR
jgi:predicted RNA-binding Zn ribbon-like protein